MFLLKLLDISFISNHNLRVVKTDKDIIGEQCIKNVNGMLKISDEDKKITLKSYHEKLLHTELACNGNSFPGADTVCDVPCLIDRDMVRESIIKMKSRKGKGPSGLLSEMVKATSEARVNIISDLVN